MKFVLSIILNAVLVYLGGLLLPWWSLVPIIFLISAILNQNNIASFLSGFLAIFCLWAGMAWIIDQQNHQILSQRIANLLPLQGNSFLLILITGLIGGIVAGLASLSGSLLRSHKTAPDNYYNK